MRDAALLAALLLAAWVPPVEADASVATYVVQWRHDLSPAERADALALGAVVEELRVIRGGIVALTPAQAAALETRPYVERLDPEEPIELHLDRSRDLTRMPATHTRGVGPTGRGVTVAVVDSGLDATHPDFEGRVRANLLWVNGAWQQGGVDTDGHGTHVAGIAVGSGAESGGALAGFAPEAGLAFLGFGDQFTTTVALRAFDWISANQGAMDIRVVSNSWGRAESGRRFDPGDPVIRAQDRLVDDGVVIVFSASNHGAEGSSTIALEAQDPNVVTVGAVDDAAKPADFSSRGPVLREDGSLAEWVKPDVVADGVAILSARSKQGAATPTDPLAALPTSVATEGAYYKEMQGTSQAAPAVAGLVAAMLEADPDLTPRDVKRILLETAVDVHDPGPDDVTGFGLVDAADALAVAGGREPDRGNVIVAGGEDTFISRGRVVGDERLALQTTPSPAVRQDGTIETRFPVKPGATRVAFDLSWTGSQRVAAYLHDGERTLGPFTRVEREGGRSVVRGVAEAPTTGVWSLLARPAGSGDLEYATTVHVAIKECPTCVAVVDPAYLDVDTGLSGTDAALYFAEDTWLQTQDLMRRVAEGGPERTYVLMAAGALALVGVLRWLRG